jgi:hypothetical protein
MKIEVSSLMFAGYTAVSLIRDVAYHHKHDLF